MLSIFPDVHRINSKQYLYSHGYVHLNESGTVFRDHNTAQHEKLFLEDNSKIYSNCHLQKQDFPFKINPAFTTSPWTPPVRKRC